MKSKDTSWGKMATWYDDMLEQNEDSFQAKVILPNVLRIVDPKPGIVIVENACGQGYFCRAIQEKGAKVIGADISPELIALAKKHSPKEIEYFTAPAEKLPFIENSTVDVAVIILAIQNIENIDGVFAECSRILKKDGRLVLVLNHPAFRIPKRSSWEWAREALDMSKDAPKIGLPGEVHFRRIDGYMSESRIEIDMTPGERDNSKKKSTVTFHRPLQTYFKSMSKSGFAVTRLEEWISHKKSEKGKRAEEEDRMRKEIPVFLCLEMKKL